MITLENKLVLIRNHLDWLKYICDNIREEACMEAEQKVIRIVCVREFGR